MSALQPQYFAKIPGKYAAVQLPAGPPDCAGYAAYRERYDEVAHWCGATVTETVDTRDEIYCYLEIPTLEGPHTASDGYWIVQGVEGEFWAVRNDIFTKTYERLS
jgi:hypothetical protein